MGEGGGGERVEVRAGRVGELGSQRQFIKMERELLFFLVFSLYSIEANRFHTYHCLISFSVTGKIEWEIMYTISITALNIQHRTSTGDCEKKRMESKWN